ncbi:MAG: magnesium transporter [Promethearchaeia archaeon]
MDIELSYFKKIVKESFLIVVFSSIMGLFSGTVLSASEKVLYAFPILLLIIPSLNSLIGDLSTVLISRLTSHLYIGTIEPTIKFSERLKEDFLGLFYTVLVSLGLLIGLGYLIAINTNIKIVNPLLVIIILLITILFLFCSLFIFLFIGAIFLFNKGKDPNNLLIPLLTSLADFLTPFILILLITIFI